MRDYLKNDSGLFEASIAFFILNARGNEVSSPVILGANTYPELFMTLDSNWKSRQIIV